MFNDHLRQAPFFRLFFPLAAGIVLGQHADFSHVFLVILSFMVLVVTFAIYFVCNNSGNLVTVRFFGILVIISLLCLGISFPVPSSPVPVKPALMIACVTVAPVEREKTYKLILGRVCIPADSCYIPGKVLAYLGNKEHENPPLPGNKILFYSDLKPVPEPANPFDFNLRKYYSKKEILYQIYIPSNKWMIVDDRVPANLRFVIETYRYRLGARILELFPNRNESAMLTALYLGINGYMGQEEKISFSRAGAMHFLAVSGLHTGMVFYILQLILRIIPGGVKTKTLRTILIIILLWGYALFTGLSGSVARACLMLSFWLAANLARRASSAFNILFFSAMIILVVNPGMLYDVGFQLSYLAVAGILLFLPHASESISKTGWLTGKIISLIIISASAQVATLPLSIYYFHQISHYFILTNLLISPLIGILLYTAPLLLVSNFITWIKVPVINFVDFITCCTLRIIDVINGMPGSWSDGYHPGIFQVGLMYIMIISAYIFLFMKKRQFIFAVLGSVLLYLLGETYKEYIHNKQMQIFVYHIQGNSAVNIVAGSENILITDSDLSGTMEWKALHQFWDKLKAGDPDIMTFQKDSILISHDCLIKIIAEQEVGFTFIGLQDIRIGIINDSFNAGSMKSHIPGLHYLIIRNNC